MHRESDWLTLRLYHYEEEKDSLLINCIFPLLKNLKSKQCKAYLKRHWLNGPHIDINITGFADNTRNEVKAYLEKEIQMYLKINPSQTKIDKEKYEELSKKLALLEHNDSPYTPIYNNNTIRFIVYKRNVNVFQNSMPLILKREKFLTEFTPIIEKIIKSSSTKNQRLIICAGLMALVANRFTGGIKFGYLSFRSHAEGFIHESKRRNIESVMVKDFKRTEELIKADIESFIDNYIICKDGIENESIFNDWMNLTETTWKQLEQVESVSINSPNDFLSIVNDPKKVNELSHFHKHLIKSSEGVKLLSSKDFNIYRFIINLLYEQLPLMGFNSKDRNMMCYILSNAVEQRLNVNWKDLMGYREVE
ncbi:lantibiotic dehydratase C-terminal domain-containing protein [Bacillus atrophaeus]|uniref:lantibiotic dehydratase C-terminal domain-containing protein n=1 Tax=Bacillus atrophaeus TaxID=1452 RepID=UPI00227DA6AE|nr:lantibiotic dehydratase C-terminal domain-containing protein [Bacillus atrophaeus]MCY8499903.1 hypothetical protein [Bacillus atrophaeus]MCY8812438.1 hypothetical protein [Bacillus atrophaeus]MCY8822394.1 hypothetical protein [Bacillus atrophaeus]MCY8829240.1 hypothetical protein [Bacillus atrophaeus]MCY8832914.1 hypothetical protein [Bacillus atrophaeus]